jgi:hypothetical protein
MKAGEERETGGASLIAASVLIAWGLRVLPSEPAAKA